MPSVFLSAVEISIVEIVILMSGAIILGITIHFFITSRRSLQNSPLATSIVQKNMDEWKLRYFNDIEARDKEISSLQQKLTETEEHDHILSIEAEEMRIQNKKLRAQLETIRTAPPSGDHPNFMEQLRQAQGNLLEHNEIISQLLGKIDLVKEAEEKQSEILKNNEILANQVEELQSRLYEKEKEISIIRQKADLTNEMNVLLDNTYSEFNSLQGKISKLESQVTSSKMVNMEFEDLKEAHYKLSRDYEDQKVRYNTTLTETRKMQVAVEELEDKLKEANHQRQQLQKRVSYLEELNKDLQFVSEANKKLEGQLRRIGELESMLNVVSQERDQLVRRQVNNA
jgi:chromosome segregation ATPase